MILCALLDQFALNLLRVTWSELAVESFLPQSYMGFSIIDFEAWSREQKMFVFYHLIGIRNEPVRLGSARFLTAYFPKF